jgi:hypothetical protein
VFRAVDIRSFFECSVIHPQDDILLFVACRTHSNWFIVFSEYYSLECEGAATGRSAAYREHVASNAIPFITAGDTPALPTAVLTQIQTAFQMSVEDCS